MSMNIGPMLRALLGDSVPTDSKALELRIGQIVRGVLLEMLENGEALMNIGGVPVRAKLEADLPAGRGTLLQVQPSSGGTVVLKPLAETEDAAPDENFRETLKSFGLPEQKWAFELLRGLKRDGYPVGKDTAAYFRTALGLKPSGEDTSEWTSAAGVAFRRGLPPTETTVASLKQALYGSPIQERWSGFAAALQEWAADARPKSPAASELASRLQTLLTEGEALLNQGEDELLGRAAGTPRSGAAADVPAAPRPGGAAIAVGTAHAAGSSVLPMDEPPATGGGNVPNAPKSDAAARGLAEAPAAFSARSAPEGPESQTTPSARSAEPKLPADPAAAVRPRAETEAADADFRSAVRPETLPSGAGASKPEAAHTRSEPAWIGRFLQWLGVEHEHRLSGALTAAKMTGEPEAMPADNFKSALLALASQEEAPPALREAAQSLAGQITGQQLLLSPDRQPNQPFSLMTLFVPMRSPDGDTTAAVHVQTRRGRKGEWDSDNCRLLFDLRMPRLGDTIVDVQVVNRIVSVKLMNDFPGMAELTEQTRGELEAGLSAAGFQLLSLASSPLPTKESAQGKQADAKEKSVSLPSSAASAYAAKAYRGVDFRV
ncbi:hypothetical protein [Cohnella caldifontis]|uniref:hypothetical protein n=1 Tax=Cohnella caldifontis TaxID=3027471 RepID=UPI0023ECAB63|nr:hypothetical protein [Cohnella sp. YIM B05605]